MLSRSAKFTNTGYIINNSYAMHPRNYFHGLLKLETFYFLSIFENIKQTVTHYICIYKTRNGLHHIHVIITSLEISIHKVHYFAVPVYNIAVGQLQLHNSHLGQPRSTHRPFIIGSL